VPSIDPADDGCRAGVAPPHRDPHLARRGRCDELLGERHGAVHDPVGRAAVDRDYREVDRAVLGIDLEERVVEREHQHRRVLRTCDPAAWRHQLREVVQLTDDGLLARVREASAGMGSGEQCERNVADIVRVDAEFGTWGQHGRWPGWPVTPGAARATGKESS
jgi:hypothetical protein